MGITCFDEKSIKKNNSLLGKDKNKIINSFTLELSLKINLKDEDEDEIISVHEISHNRIGILSLKSLSIYSLKTFFKIVQINYGNKKKLDFEEKKEILIYANFLELKNFDLVLWTSKLIYLLKFCNKKYILYQKINLLNKDMFVSKLDEILGKLGLFDINKNKINSICELSNGNLIICLNSGLNIYHKIKIKEKDIFEYKLLSEHEIYNVKNIIELNSNELILLQKYHSPNTSLLDVDNSFYEYSISIYNIQNKKEKKITKIKVISSTSFMTSKTSEISYLIKNNYLLVRYGYKLDIYNIKDNMKLIKTEKEKIVNEETYSMIGKIKRSYKTLKDEMNVEFISDYFDDLFIVKDFKGNFKFYKFNNKKIQFYKDFPFQNLGIKGIIKLKNNNIIIYSDCTLYVYKCK